MESMKPEAGAAETTLGQAAADLDRHNARKGKSDRTRQWYEQSLRYFDEFLAETRRSRLMADITLADAQEFMDRLKARGHKVQSIQTRSRALRSFFHWFDGRDEHRLKRLEVPRLKQDSIEQVEILQTWEIAAIERAFNPRTFSGLRDRAIVSVMLDAGLRRAEVVGLDLKPQQLQDGCVRVLGKGGKYRSIPFGYSTGDYLREYLARRGGYPGDRFFITGAGDPITANTIQDIFRDLRRRSGVRRIHPHLLRHTYATRFLMQNPDRIVDLQRYLGHTTLTMVMHYVHLAGQQVREEDRALAPMDRLRESYRPRRAGRPKALPRWPAEDQSADGIPRLRVVSSLTGNRRRA